MSSFRKSFNRTVSGVALMVAAAVGVTAPTEAEAQGGTAEFGTPEYNYEMGRQALHARLQESFSRCVERAERMNGRNAYRGTQSLGRSAQGVGRAIDRIDGRDGGLRAGDIAAGVSVLLNTLGAAAEHQGQVRSTQSAVEQCQLRVQQDAVRGEEMLANQLARDQARAERDARRSGASMPADSTLSPQVQQICERLAIDVASGRVRPNPDQSRLCRNQLNLR